MRRRRFTTGLARSVAGSFLGISLLLALQAQVTSPDEEAGSFQVGVLPILTKAGCNAGSCHGAATGQGGFKLSLLGYDPEEDHDHITREFGGRRIDTVNPSESLLLKKASGQLDHEGGRRLASGSESFALLSAWIRTGAPYGSPGLKISGIEVEPSETLVSTTSEGVRLRVFATLTNLRRVEVTGQALYVSNDESVAEVSRDGIVHLRGTGAASIMVRYGGQFGVARVLRPSGTRTVSIRRSDRPGIIDEEIARELERMRIPPSAICNDPTFVRRVFLDLIGCLPTERDLHFFKTRSSLQDWRSSLVDELLKRPEFADYWTSQFADLLLLGGKRSAAGPSRVYHQWLREELASNVPYDRLVRNILTAAGNIQTNGPANFFTLSRDPRDLAEHVGRMFLGTRIGCARCHAHPNDRWTRDDYHGFAAYFARLKHEQDNIWVSDDGELENPKTGRVMVPKVLGSDSSRVDTESDRRVELANWLTSPDNPLFSRTLVNRVWKQFFGRGLVEPVDDLRFTNPATHPVLLEKLGTEFARHGFDLKWLIRSITHSKAYQRSSKATDENRADDLFLSHARTRSLPAPVLLDMIAQVTGVPEAFDGREGVRAVQLEGPLVASYALDVLGRCSREGPCDSAAGGGGLAMALHLINGDTINGRLSRSPFVHSLVQEKDESGIVERLYSRLFCRAPSGLERKLWTSFLRGRESRREAIEDAFWTLLNTREFVTNH